MTIQEKAQAAADMFESKTRPNGDKIIVLKDEAPEELKDAIHEAHEDRFPNDWIYGTFADLISIVADYDSDLDEIRHEIVDGYVDVYTSDLTNWLNESNYNVYYITEAQEEYGPETDGFKILQLAQYKAIDEVFGYVQKYLEQE